MSYKVQDKDKDIQHPLLTFPPNRGGITTSGHYRALEIKSSKNLYTVILGK